MVSLLCALALSVSPSLPEKRVVAMLLRTGKDGVVVLDEDRKMVKGTFPIPLHEGTQVRVPQGGLAIIFDGRRAKRVREGVWSAPSRPLEAKIVDYARKLGQDRIAYITTATRGDEPFLNTPYVLALAALPGPDRRVAVYYAVKKSRAEGLAFALDPLETPCGKPQGVYEYKINGLYKVEIGPVKEGTTVAVDRPPFRGEALLVPPPLSAEALTILAEAAECGEDYEGLLAKVDLLAAEELDAFALEAAYAALTKASGPEEKAEVDVLLWSILRRARSTLADVHLPNKVKP